MNDPESKSCSTLKTADDALYQAERAGRNRTILGRNANTGQ